MLKKQALSDSVSQRDPEDLQGQSKFKKLEEFPALTAIRRELQKLNQPPTMSNKNAQNEGCSSIKTKLNEPMIKHKREKKMSEETISVLKADLLASRERNKGFKQARITITGEL